MKRPKIGAHVSIAGGLSNAIIRAEEIGAECMQIFAGSPRRYDVSFPKKEEIDLFKKSNISPIFIHASYLLNLATEDFVLREKSIKNLSESLRFADLIGAKGVVYHPGSPKGGDKKEAIQREAESIKEVFRRYSSKSTLILENTAGKKKIGVSAEEIGELIKRSSQKNIGVCIDTAHSFESGDIVDFSTEEIRSWSERWEKSVGLSNILLLHVNDSITKQGSQNDRHANIGEGFIGKKGFSELAKSGVFSNIPWIIEVPGIDGNGPDKENIERLKSIFDFSLSKK